MPNCKPADQQDGAAVGVRTTSTYHARYFSSFVSYNGVINLDLLCLVDVFDPILDLFHCASRGRLSKFILRGMPATSVHELMQTARMLQFRLSNSSIIFATAPISWSSSVPKVKSGLRTGRRPYRGVHRLEPIGERKDHRPPEVDVVVARDRPGLSLRCEIRDFMAHDRIERHAIRAPFSIAHSLGRGACCVSEYWCCQDPFEDLSTQLQRLYTGTSPHTCSVGDVLLSHNAG